MSDQPQSDPSQDSRTPVDLRYQGQSGRVDDDTLQLFADDHDEAVGFQGTVQDPIRVRELFTLLYETVKSDLRYVPKDRSAYLAFQQQRRAKSASRSAIESQREYFEWLRKNDPLAWLILDPVVTAHPDRLVFEVFSKDEGAYLRMDLDWSLLKLKGDPKYGTTNVDYGEALYKAVQDMRGHRETTLAMGAESLGVKTEGVSAAIEKHIEIPNSWLHGFLQVQSAATLADEIRFDMAPMDLYNLLRHLRLNADQKGKGRSIRAELIPGERPRLVLEPWELVLEVDGAPYEGKDAQVVRIWGRRRLMLLQRILPFLDKVEVCLIGSGMPCFWIFHCGPATLTLGMTGYIASNWSQTVHLDVMLPSTDGDAKDHWAAIEPHLDKAYTASLEDLTAATGLSKKDATAGLQWACRNGEAIFDLGTDTYRRRPLLHGGVDPEALRFRNPAERHAQDLLEGRGGSVKIKTTAEVPGRGMEYTAEVAVEADQREYETSFQLTDDGRVYRANCTCAHFRDHGLKEGPCAHLLALRILLAEKEKELRAQRGTKKRKAETRTYVRRDDTGEEVHTLRFRHEELKVQWGLRTDLKHRRQRLRFNSVDEARQAFLARAAELEARGFMNATE